jgi:hypothetical protein
MRSSSLKPLINAGIHNARAYRDKLINEWYLDKPIVDNLAEYFQRKIESKDLFNRIKDGNITVGNKEYNIIWINGPSVIRNHGKALMSFRYCPLLNIGYVLIKKLENGTDIETLGEQIAGAIATKLIKETNNNGH